MALLFDTAATDEAADDTVQVIDLGDIAIAPSDAARSPSHRGRRRRRRRSTLWNVARLALVFALGMALSVPTVAVVRYLQRDGDSSQVDIDDRQRELPDLPQPVGDDEPPQQDPDAVPPAPSDDTATDSGADPAAKAALKEATATGTAPAATSPTASTGPTDAAESGPAAPGTTPSTATPTTAATTTTTTTPSATLPDGSPNPLGPGPDGSSTSMPDPWGSDVIPGAG